MKRHRGSNLRSSETDRTVGTTWRVPLTHIDIHVQTIRQPFPVLFLILLFFYFYFLQFFNRFPKHLCFIYFFIFIFLKELLYLFIYLFIYLFLAVLGLRFCARAFSSCGEWGPLFIAVRGPLTIAASLVAEHRLQTHKLSSCSSRA